MEAIYRGAKSQQIAPNEPSPLKQEANVSKFK